MHTDSNGFGLQQNCKMPQCEVRLDSSARSALMAGYFGGGRGGISTSESESSRRCSVEVGEGERGGSGR